MKNNITDYSKILSYGKDNSISANELQMIMGFDNPRSLRSDIHKARLSGQVILSTCKESGGYYLPANDGEVQEFIATYSSQALSLLRVLRSARQYLNRNEQQLTFKDLVAEWDSEEGASYD